MGSAFAALRGLFSERLHQLRLPRPQMQDTSTVRLSLLNCSVVHEPAIPTRVQRVYAYTGLVNRAHQRQLILIPKPTPFLMPDFEQSCGGGVAAEQHDPGVEIGH